MAIGFIAQCGNPSIFLSRQSSAMRPTSVACLSDREFR
jgi:hypothetical protein